MAGLIAPAVAALATAVSSMDKKHSSRPKNRSSRQKKGSANRPKRPKRPSRTSRDTRPRSGVPRRFAKTSRSSVPLMAGTRVSVPVTFGEASGSHTLTLNPMDGPVADFDRGDCLTIRGCLQLANLVKTGSDYVTESKNGAFSSTTSIVSFGLKPASIAATATKLMSLAGIFAHYRIRRLLMRYVPGVPTSQQGTFHLAYSPDPDALGYGAGLTGFLSVYIREFETSFVTPVWSSAELLVKHDGSRCYTNDANDSVDENFQGMLFGVVSGGAASTTYGRIECEYVIDFFSIRAEVAAPAPRRGPDIGLSTSRLHPAIPFDGGGPPPDTKDSKDPKLLGLTALMRERYDQGRDDDVKSLTDVKIGGARFRQSEPIDIPATSSAASAARRDGSVDRKKS